MHSEQRTVHNLPCALGQISKEEEFVAPCLGETVGRLLLITAVKHPPHVKQPREALEPSFLDKFLSLSPPSLLSLTRELLTLIARAKNSGFLSPQDGYLMGQGMGAVLS